MKKDTQSLIDAMSSGPVLEYLSDNEHRDLRRIILAHKEILGIPTARLLEQITVRSKAKDKLPLYYNTAGIVYPPQQNFEQSSSQRTAQLKGEIAAGLTAGNAARCADLTGGFGVDAFFLSRVFTFVDCIEPNPTLLDLAKHSHKLLGATNIVYHNVTAEEFLSQSAHLYDFVYVDPSRRTIAKKKAITFDDSEPNILNLAPALLERSKWLLIKASPLMDIQAAIAQLPRVDKVYVVSVQNECKEVLFLSGRGARAVPEIVALNLQSDGSSETFAFTLAQERAAVANYSDPQTFLYEPNASILKAGAFKLAGMQFGLDKIHPNTHLYTGQRLVENFPGRKFRVDALVRPDAKEIRKDLPDGYANVTTRNYPLTPADLKKKLRLKDGGNRFVIGFTGLKKKYVAVTTRL